MPDTPLFPVKLTPKQAAQERKNLAAGKTVGQGSGGQPGAAPNVQGSPNSPCLISWPKANAPLVGSVGGGCILSKTNVRAMAGGLMLGSGAALTAVGLILLVAAGFKRTGGLGKAAAVAGVIPGGQPVAAGLRAAQGRVNTGRSARPSRRTRQAAEEVRLERAVGEPRENTNLREGRGAIRENPRETARRRRESSARQQRAETAERARARGRAAASRDRPPF